MPIRIMATRRAIGRTIIVVTVILFAGGKLALEKVIGKML